MLELCYVQVLETCQQWVNEATADRAACASRMAKFLREHQAGARKALMA